MIPPVVDATFLDSHPDVLLADVRWYLDGTDGAEAFREAHLPDAIWVDLDNALAGHDRPSTEGRHPLPTPEAFAAAMGALGIGDDTVVVAYDDNGGMTAGRLVTMLRMLGRDAAVLDGGLTAWNSEGGPVSTGPARAVVPAEFTATPWPAGRLASADDAAAHARAGGAVIDARAAERFTGAVTQVDPRPGHIPGARNAPWAAVLGADGRFKSPDALREHFTALGADDDSVVYCGSGVSACVNVIAMELAGLTPPRLYVASWSGWSSDPDRPAELGPSSAPSDE